MIRPAREPAVLAAEVGMMEPDGRTLERLDADDTRHVHVVPKAGAWGVESEHVAWKHGGEPCLICGVTYPEYVDGIVPGAGISDDAARFHGAHPDDDLRGDA